MATKLFLGVLVFLTSCNERENAVALSSYDSIRLNQIGYYPKSVKKAVVVAFGESSKFYLLDQESGKVVFEGKLSENREWTLAGERVQIADFSSYTQEGTYRIEVDGLGKSHPFKIAKEVLHPVLLGSVKALYFQRASSELTEEHAGKWKRKMGHPDDSVVFHSSSGYSSGHLSAPGGWYDAGDYNKYIVNASFPLGQLLLLEEQYPHTIGDAALNIPESGNGINDFLDEIRYEIDWTLTMQDEDGGLFHKLTAKSFEGMVMPEAAKKQRYIVGKGTAATLDFVASSAMAARVFSEIDPEFSEECLIRAKKAYDWAKENPNKTFKNPEDISTGEYGDANFDDEWFWATAELYITTKDPELLTSLQELPLNFRFRAGESWTAYMRYLGMFSLLERSDLVPESYYHKLKEGIVKEADVLVEKSSAGDYFQPVTDFQWGSNSDILNAAMIMASAYRLEKKPAYLVAVQQAVDYILGANATSYSFVTGYGAKPPMFIHHRQSAADRIVDPVPGLLSGGPNSRQQDTTLGVSYPKSVPPMKSWVDVEESFASNEICLNWNAPLTYILGFLENESN